MLKCCRFQVSRRTFIRALNQRGSVILVPGGQAELIHTGRLCSRKEFVIYPKHKGMPQHASTAAKRLWRPIGCRILARHVSCQDDRGCLASCAMSALCAGFIRLAMEQNAHVVPVLCLGELSTLRNFIDLPQMQVCSCAAMSNVDVPCSQRYGMYGQTLWFFCQYMEGHVQEAGWWDVVLLRGKSSGLHARSMAS